jgi:hypothetical protein
MTERATVAAATRGSCLTIPGVETLSLPKLLHEMDTHIFSLRSRRQNKALYDDFDGLR